MEDTDRVDLVLCANGVRYQELHDLLGAEARIAEPRQNKVDAVRREEAEVRRGRLGVVGPTGEERELGTTVAVRDPNGACKLDAVMMSINTWFESVPPVEKSLQVTEGDLVLKREGFL